MSHFLVRPSRPTWKNYSYDQLQTPNIADGQCTACRSGYVIRKLLMTLSTVLDLLLIYCCKRIKYVQMC